MVRLNSVAVECAFEPLHLLVVVGDDVKAQRAFCMFGMRGNEHLRCEHDLLPLAGIDGLHGAGETTCATGAYFANHQHCAVTHHQIEFTATATDIASSEEHTSEIQSLMRISYAVI